MSTVVVDEIIERIRSLPGEKRVYLDELSAMFEEEEWQHQAAHARESARQRGITQDLIDQSFASVLDATTN